MQCAVPGTFLSKIINIISKNNYYDNHTDTGVSKVEVNHLGNDWKLKNKKKNLYKLSGNELFLFLC